MSVQAPLTIIEQHLYDMFRVLLSAKGALQYITIRTSYKHLHLKDWLC